MAKTFSKQTVNGVEYSVLDAQAREDIAAEVTARQNADTAEVTARQNADNEIKKALYGSNAFIKSLFENGSINASTGENVSNSSRIRLIGYMPWTVYRLRSTNSDLRFTLYAYQKDGTYVGGWYDTEFISDVKGYASIDLRPFYNNATYKDYLFRIAIYITGGTARVDTIEGVIFDNYPIDVLYESAANLGLDYVKILQTGTDFNTVTATGCYLVENYSQISSDTNYPPNVANGGRLFVINTIGRSRYAQIWISYPSNGEPELWTRNYNGTSWNKWCRVGEIISKNIRVLGYNIGKFNWGQDGGLSQDVAEKIANYKTFFGKVNPDIAMFAELTDYIDSSETYNTNDTLIIPLFNNKTNFHGCAVECNFGDADTIESDGGIYLRNNNNEYAGTVGRLECYINNKHLIMAGGFLRVASSAQDRAEAFQNFLTSIAGYDYAIIYLDTNVADETEREAIRDIAKNAGYTVANGGYFGTVDTLVPTSAYKKIDNIFVKGRIKLKNFYAAADEYDSLSSDHIPIVADLCLY